MSEVKTVEIPLFSELEDRAGYKYKVANPDSPQVVPQSGVIIIEALKRNQLKQPRISFSKVTDPDTGIIYGIPNGFDVKTNEPKFQRIILGDMLQFDLSIPSDRRLWMVISRHECLKGSPFQRGIPKFRKVDIYEDANNVIKDSNLVVSAINVINNLSPVEMYDMAVNMGISVERNSPVIIHSTLLDKATKNAQGFLDVYNSKNKDVITVFKRCLAVGLIRSDVRSGYIWKDSYPLGMTEVQAMNSMLENTSLLTTMDLESKSKSNFYKTNATPEQMQAVRANQELLKNPTSKASEQTGFMSTTEIKNTLSELEVEKRRTKELNDRMEAFLNSQKPKQQDVEVVPENGEPDYNAMELEELQDMAFRAGYTLARKQTDRTILISKIKSKK